jgi:hypothetical protein
MDRTPLPMNPGEQLLSSILQERDAYSSARTGLTPEEMGSARRAAIAAVLTGLVERDLPPRPESTSSLRVWVRAESQLHALLEACATEAIIRDEWEVHGVLSDIETELDHLTAEIARAWLPIVLKDVVS